MRIVRATALALVSLLVVAWVAIAVSNKARLLVAKNYFKHERLSWTPRLIQFGVVRPVRMQVEQGVNLRLDPSDFVSWSILRDRTWQPEVWDSLSSALKPGGVLLDVGAHIGYFTMKGAARVGANGRVVAFEPNPETLVELHSNVAANHYESVVTVAPVACSDKDQQLTLYAARGANTGGSSLSKENAGAFDDAPKPYPVRGRPIDDVVAELGLTRIDAIKIDVEGAEVSVLQGAIKTLSKYHPKVVLEVDERQLAAFGSKPSDIADTLRLAGYNHSRKVDDSDVEWYCLCPENTAASIRTADLSRADQLVSGFYGVENGLWRWTAKDFVIALAAAKNPKPVLTVEVSVPRALLDRIGGSTTLRARVGAVELAPETFNSDGNFTYRRELKPMAENGVVEVQFGVDKALRPEGTDPRELGIVVVSASIR